MKNSDIELLSKVNNLLKLQSPESELSIEFSRYFERMHKKNEKEKNDYQKKAQYYRNYSKDWKLKNPEKNTEHQRKYIENKKTNRYIVKCSECNWKEFEKRKGQPGRWYCNHKNARICFHPSGCSPALICKTDRHNSELTIKTSPRWCPLKSSQEIIVNQTDEHESESFDESSNK